MSGAADDLSMEKTRRATEVEALIREIQRYLRYLDALRSTNRPPRRREERRRKG